MLFSAEVYIDDKLLIISSDVKIVYYNHCRRNQDVVVISSEEVLQTYSSKIAP